MTQSRDDDQTMEGWDDAPQAAPAAANGTAEEELTLEQMREQTEAALGKPKFMQEPGDEPPPNVSEIFPPVSREEEVLTASRNSALIPPKDDEPEEEEPPDDDGEQASYLPPDVPDGHLAPPLSDAFANATWMEAGEQFRALLDEVLAFDEFAPLREFRFALIWFHKGRPQHPWATLDGDREPALLKVVLPDPLVAWYALDHEWSAMPHAFLGLMYKHFEDLRENSGQYYHRDIIKREMHIALSKLDAESGVLAVRPPELVEQSVKTVERYGAYSPGLAHARAPLFDWSQRAGLAGSVDVQE